MLKGDKFPFLIVLVSLRYEGQTESVEATLRCARSQGGVYVRDQGQLLAKDQQELDQRHYLASGRTEGR